MGPLSGLKSRILRNRKIALPTLALVIAFTGFLVAAYEFHLLGSQQVNCWARPANAPNTAVFTIVMANEGLNIGFNGSGTHSGLWPVMNVTVGENVIIHLISNDTLQAHGFIISHYFPNGLRGGLAPGACYDVRFVANVQGSFYVQCDIGTCTIHWAMLRGQLNVNP